MVIVIAIAGAVFGEEAARGAIFNELKGVVGPAGAEVIQLLLRVYYSAQFFFVGAEVIRQYAVWFGCLRHAPHPPKQQ